MNQANRDFLRDINQRFYDQQSRSFSRTRQRPWPGWEQAWDLVRKLPRQRLNLFEEACSGNSPWVDVGCGNGRLARFLCERLEEVGCARLDYLGLDMSLALLQEASETLKGEAAGLNLSLRCSWLKSQLAGTRRDLLEVRRQSAACVFAFGLMHHIPARAGRRAFLEQCSTALRPGGLLLVSFWQFTDRARLVDRALDWRCVPLPDPESLESGDFLLPWGEIDSTEPRPWERSRYCHHTSDEEAGELIDGLGLWPLGRFYADGGNARSNLYYVLQKR